MTSDARLSDLFIAKIIAGTEASRRDMWRWSDVVRSLDPATILSAFTELEASRVVMKQMAEARKLAFSAVVLLEEWPGDDDQYRKAYQLAQDLYAALGGEE